MRIRTIRLHIKEGVRGLFKNRLMSLASIVTVAACSFILIISFCVVINLDFILEQIEASIPISVFIEDDVGEEGVLALSEKISEIKHVTGITYISAEEALEKAKERWGSPEMLRGLEKKNPFPRSFDLSLASAKYQGEVIAELNKLTGYGIEKITHAQKETEFLVAMSTGLRIASVIIVLILGSVSVAIIMNTIKITVYIRKNEINIMKYVGATDWFIRWPFLVEGVLIGLIGAGLPVIMTFLGYDKTIDVIYEKILIIQKLVVFKSGAEIFSLITPVTLILGGVLGVVGSVTSIRKHLNV